MAKTFSSHGTFLMIQKNGKCPPCAAAESAVNWKRRMLMMYMQYKFGSRPAVNMEQFQKNMAESQAWAESVGMTEQDIKDAIKEIRAQNRTGA